MSRPLNIVVTGQLRTPERFERSLHDWAALRAAGIVGRVVVVTWEQEAIERAECCRLVSELGGEIVTRPEPPVRGIGHIWPQTLALDVGLQCFDDHEPVLKTRTDLWMDPTLIRELAAGPAMREPPTLSEVVFEQRVWVPWFELTKPFYLADECFAGLAGDLRKLINYDESYSLLYDIGCGITHIRRFLPAFRANFPVLQRFLDTYTDAGHFSPDRWARVTELLQDDRYLDVLAAYYQILAGAFRIGAPDGAIEFRSWSSGTPQPDPTTRMNDAFVARASGLEPGGHLFAHGEDWLRACLAGELPPDALGSRFQDAVARGRGFVHAVGPAASEQTAFATHETS